MSSTIKHDTISIDVKRQGPVNRIEWETSCDKDSSDFRCFEIFCTFYSGSSGSLGRIYSPVHVFLHTISPNIPRTYWVLARFSNATKDFTSGKITITSDFEDEKTQHFQTVTNALKYLRTIVELHIPSDTFALECGNNAIKIMERYVETKD